MKGTTKGKDLLESMIRKIVREEFEFYFNKLQTQLNEMRSMQSTIQPSSTTTANSPGYKVAPNSQLAALREKFRAELPRMADSESPKFTEKANPTVSENVLMKTILSTDPSDMPDDDEVVESIMDESALNSLAKSPQHQALAKALTQDYSHLFS